LVYQKIPAVIEISREDPCLNINRHQKNEWHPNWTILRTRKNL